MMDPNDFDAAMGNKKRRHEDDFAAGTGDEDDSDNEHQTSKSRGTVTVQIFIKKTYTMINDCDPKIASWTPEGDKFVIKDPDMFAQKVIPQYFDHNKFSSFTRQLNFYKFTREQSKAIKKSDNSSEIAKHQTFYHKYFQKGRPDLLKHLQRSRKTNNSSGHHDHDDIGHNAKKPKTVTSGGMMMMGGDPNVLEQLSDLIRRVTESEMTIKNLQQENAALSFGMQKLQQQDEMKQRALVALEEHIRVMENQITQAIQQQQTQINSMSGPLPFSRESSLSAVNGSTLMRYLSMNPGLNAGASALQRQLTPLGQFSAAAAAENIVQQANEKNARTMSPVGPSLGRHPRMKGAGGGIGGPNSSTAGGGTDSSGPTLARHPRMRGGTGGLGGVNANNGSASGAGGGGGAADLSRHMKMKQEPPEGSAAATAAAVAAQMDRQMEAAGGGATLRRHPRMKGSEMGGGQQGGQQNNNNNNAANALNRNAFQNNSLSGMGDAVTTGMDGRPVGLSKANLQGQGMGDRNDGGGGPNSITSNFNNGSSQLGSFQSQSQRSNSIGGAPGPSAGAPFSVGSRSVSPKPDNSQRGPAPAGGLSERDITGLGSLGGNSLGAGSLGSLGAGGLAGLGASGLGGSGLGSAGLGGGLGLAGSGLAGLGGLGGSGLGSSALGSTGLGGLGGTGLGGSGLGSSGLGGTGLGGSGLGGSGLGAGLGASGLGAAGLGGATGLGAANLAAATGLQEREISNIGTDVTREESFSIASLLEMARGSQQQI